MTDLPKWPGLLVVGEKISEEMADEILIRTNYWSLFFFKDKNFLNKVLTQVYIDSLPVEDRITNNYLETDMVVEKTNSLDLTYLYNERIISSWVGGLHGWLDWDGTIFCNNYNIGKWPEIRTIKEDLEKIANAFPFLNFQLQILDQEIYCDNEHKPLFTFEVKNKEIKIIDTKKLICSPEKHVEDVKEENFLFQNQMANKKHITRVVKAFSRFFKSLDY